MSKGFVAGVPRLRAALPLAALFLTACPPPPPPPTPIVKPPPAEPPEPPPPPLAPARWIESKGNTVIGPDVAEGSLLLVGGRRVLVAKDGTAKTETAPAPEGLVGFTEVVTASGARKIVAYSEHGVFRIDDPLGEMKTLARTDGEVWRVSSGPGVVAVWDFNSDVPRFIDVETGDAKTLPGMPAVPANGMAFRSPKEGAAVFEAAGLAVTTDGGATWKPAGETVKGEAARVIDLKTRNGTVLASLGYGRAELPVDFGQGKLGTPASSEPPTNEGPLLKWVRRTERDPLSEVAQGGVLLPSGEALVAAAGLLARVDLKTGLVTEVIDVGGEDARACSLVRGGENAWLACSLPESESTEELYEPFGVYKIPLTGGKIAPERPLVKRNGDVEVRAAPGGGVMLLGGCGADGSSDDLCVRQPDGKWATIHPAMDPWERGAGPLADGRVAYLRGLYLGEEPPEDVAPPPGVDEGEPGEEPPPETRKAWVVAMDAHGKEQTIATIQLPPETADLSLRGYLQEDADRRVHAVVMTEEGPHMLVASPGKTPVELSKVQGASLVKVSGNFGVAFGLGKILATTDGGVTWGEISSPSRVLDLIGGSEDDGGYYGGGYYMEDYVLLSDAGLKADQFVRLGWGTPEPLPEERQLTGGMLLQRPANPPPPGPERSAVCTTEGAGTGLAPLASTYQAQDFFFKTPPAKGTRRRVSTANNGRFGLMDTIGAMAVEGPEKPGAAPTKWIFHWFDPSEIGAKVKTVTAPAPKDAPWEISLRAVASSGSRAIFSFRSGSKYYVARTKGVGIETAEMPSDQTPTVEVMFGTEKGEPIVWTTGNAIFAWPAGEQPRVVATITGRAGRSLGQPTKDGIPVLLTSTSWSLMKVLPIPPADKKDKNAKPAPHPQSVWLDGWTPVANFRRDLGRWPACGKAPKGVRLLASRYAGTATVDGSFESTQMSAYDLRVNGNEVCVANMTSLLSPLSRLGSQTIPDPKAKKPTGGAVAGPISFLRWDLVGNRAEGGDRGPPRDPPKTAPKPPPQVRKLSCKLEEKK